VPVPSKRSAKIAPASGLGTLRRQHPSSKKQGQICRGIFFPKPSHDTATTIDDGKANRQVGDSASEANHASDGNNQPLLYSELADVAKVRRLLADPGDFYALVAREGLSESWPLCDLNRHSTWRKRAESIFVPSWILCTGRRSGRAIRCCRHVPALH